MGNNRYLGNRLNPEVLNNYYKESWGQQRRHVEAQFQSGMNRTMRQGARDLSGVLEDASAPITNPIRGVANFFENLSRSLSGRPPVEDPRQGAYHPVHGNGGYNGGGYYDVGASRRANAGARHIPEEYYGRRNGAFSGRAFEAGSPVISREQAPAPVEDRSFRHVPDAPAPTAPVADAPARQISVQDFVSTREPIVVAGGSAEAFRSNRETVVVQAYPVADQSKTQVRPLESAPVDHPKVDEFKQNAQAMVDSGGRFDASTYERALRATAPQMGM
ncbi:MAG: hypothetical protein RBR86_01225 [Pseudobdellovibrionaceae bacterium]|jgi:hypothetical protein|nr:hypothetical protein [Pseudobdellovibrionaceae bacterium]